MHYYRLNNLLRWGITGGVIGGIIAIIGFWILSPPVDSIIFFVLLRVIIGSIVAMIVAPILMSALTKDKSK